MTTAADAINKDIDAIVKENASSNEVALASSLKTQNSQNIEEYTLSSKKVLTDISQEKTSQSKTFTVHSVKQVIKEVDPDEDSSTVDGSNKLSAKDRENLSLKTGIDVQDDASFAKAKAKSFESLSNAKTREFTDADITTGAGGMDGGDVETRSPLPSFDLDARSKKLIMADDGESIQPLGSNNITQRDVIREKLSEQVGMSDYNKMQNAYDTLKDFGTCIGLDDILGYGSGLGDAESFYDKINDLLNMSIKYDLGWLVGCMLPVVEMLDIKGVNKVTSRVGSAGSIGVLDAISSGGNQDKMLGSVRRERSTLRNSRSSFKDPKTIETADSIVARSEVSSKDEYFQSKRDGTIGNDPSMDTYTPVYSLADVRNDSRESRDFVNYSLGPKKGGLLAAIP